MSVKIMGLVFEAALPHNEKSVLHALADHAEDDGSRVYPSVERLIYKTELSERSIQRALQSLEARNILQCVKRGGQGQRSPTVYRILVENIPMKPAFDEWVAARRKGVTLAPLTKAPHKGVCVTPLASKGVTQTDLGCHTDGFRVSHRRSKGVTLTPDPSYEPSDQPPREPSRAHAREVVPETEILAPVAAFETRRIVEPLARAPQTPTPPTPPPPAQPTTIGAREARDLWRDVRERLAITPALRESMFRPARLYAFPDHSYLLAAHSTAALEVLERFEDTIRRELIAQTRRRDLRLTLRARERVRAEEGALV